MSQLNAGIRSATYAIKKWRGVNESPDGDTHLEGGMAARMRNWRVTDSGALRVRPGLEKVAGLLSEYSIGMEGETVICEERNVSGYSVPSYANVSLTAAGGIAMAGTAVTLSYGNWESCVNRYVGGENLTAYRFTRCVYEAAGGEGLTHVDGGAVCVDSDSLYSQIKTAEIVQWAQGIRVRAGAVELISPGTEPADYGGYFRASGGQIYTNNGRSPNGTLYRGHPVNWAADDKFIWYGLQVRPQPNATENVCVQGLWSGMVGSDEVIAAACNGHLWKLQREGETWTKLQIGTVNTSGHVGLFGFDKKLYILDGTEYRVWDGTTLRTVEGYVPCVITAAAPEGGGQMYEGINKLTLRRRQRFTSDGVAVEYHLSESLLASIELIKVDGQQTTAYSADLENGTITFQTPPAPGASNVEVWYTVSLAREETFTGDGSTKRFALGVTEEQLDTVTGVTVGGVDADFTLYGAELLLTTVPAGGTELVVSYMLKNPRTEITAKRYSEFFNGSNDNRVFLYGDGTNVALYCGLTETGKPSAEYFPDLGEMAIGEANTPITAMVRHYSRLLAFKPNGTYSVYYSVISFEDGVTSAGFYVSPVNRSLGCDAYGQAVLVENRPRTLDAKNIYEWRSSSTSGNITNDMRNAQIVSQSVAETLKSFDFGSTATFFDKLTHEYYAVSQGTAVVQNTENGAWYVYTDFPAAAMAIYADELYIGDYNGNLCRVSESVHSDMGKSIAAYWESGSISFGRDYQRKYSPTIWLGLKPEPGASVMVGIETDTTELAAEEVAAPADKPELVRVRLKSNRFTYYKLILMSDSATKAATVVSADIRVKFTGDVKGCLQ